MKKILIAVTLLTLLLPGVTRAAEAGSPDTLVWCGLDYSKVRMIGTLDFRAPDKIFPSMLAEWNSLFMKEMMPELEKMAKSVRADVEAVANRNDKANEKQIEHEDG